MCFILTNNYKSRYIILMAYPKICNKCGVRISIRQMPQGQWVAFDVGSDEPHEHGVTGRKSNRASVKKERLSKVASINRTLSDMHIVDRMGEIHDLNDIPEDWLDLTPLNLKKLFNALIDVKRKAKIQYEDRNGDITSRTLYPISIIQGYAGKQSKSKTLKVVGYCKLREDYRTFLLDSIDEVQAQSKIPKSFLDRFYSLSQQARNEITEGSNFYGLNSKVADSGRIIDAEPDMNTVQNKPKVKPKAVSERPIQTVTKTDNSHAKLQKDDGDTGAWWILGFIILIIFLSI